MRTIWKFPFPVSDVVEIGMPGKAVVLDIQMQNGTPCLWALVDPAQAIVLRQFRVYGTGNPIPDGHDLRQHVATFQQSPFVWHVYE